MYLSTVVCIAGVSGAVLGCRKPWIGGAVGLLITPVFYLNNSSSIIFTIVISLLCGFIGLASALAGSMLLSGLRGKATKTGPTYIGGFGAHHPGGLILSSEERKGLVNPKREIVVSY